MMDIGTLMVKNGIMSLALLLNGTQVKTVNQGGAGKIIGMLMEVKNICRLALTFQIFLVKMTLRHVLMIVVVGMLLWALQSQ